MREDVTRALDAAKAEAEGRMGEVEPWWVHLDPPADELWATTPESGDGWTLAALARTLYGNDVRFRTVESTDPTIVRVEPAGSVEWLAVDESDMRLVMRTLRRFGAHGSYRKAGTDEEYEF